MARDIQLAVAAAELAVADAGLADGGVDPTRIGVDLGAGLISTELDELRPAIDLGDQGRRTFDYQTYGREGIPQIQPIWLLKYLPNMLACHISILLDCQGPSNTITEAEAASNVAIGEAARIIAKGRADVMITGGADSKIHPLSLVRMSLLDQMSHWKGDPSGACRPFDAQRDGWVAGRGGRHPDPRGARARRGPRRADLRRDPRLRLRLRRPARRRARPRGHRHRDRRRAPRSATPGWSRRRSATSTPTARPPSSPTWPRPAAFGRVFGPGGVPVTALKGYLGNLVSGCGAVELIASLLGVNRGVIPPTLNCDEPDPACRLDVVRGTPRPTDNPTFVKTNLTRHGQAAALVVRAADPLDRLTGPPKLAWSPARRT